MKNSLFCPFSPLNTFWRASQGVHNYSKHQGPILLMWKCTVAFIVTQPIRNKAWHKSSVATFCFYSHEFLSPLDVLFQYRKWVCVWQTLSWLPHWKSIDCVITTHTYTNTPRDILHKCHTAGRQCVRARAAGGFTVGLNIQACRRTCTHKATPIHTSHRPLYNLFSAQLVLNEVIMTH